MIFLNEIKLNEKKLLYISLQQFYGISRFTSFYIIKKLGLSINFRTYDLSDNHKLKLSFLMKNSKILISSDLKKIKFFSKKKLIDIKTYRGYRKLQGFPVRGQRTRSNAKTSKIVKHKR